MRELSLTIIIVSWNVKHLLRDCLISIHENINIDYEIIVVDNASSDNTQEMFCEFSHVNFIGLDNNLGFAKAVNIGISQSRGDYILLLNPDTKIFKNSIETMKKFLEMNEKAGAIGPMIIEIDGQVQGSARKFPSYKTVFFGRKSLLQKIAKKCKYSKTEIPCLHHYEKTPLEVDWISGACLMIKTDAINDVGILDERFFMYWEDADWCFRAQKQGWKIYWLPTAKIEHIGGESSKKSPYKSILYFHNSVIKYFNKNMNNANIKILFLLIPILIYIRCLFELIKVFYQKNIVRTY